MLLEDYNYFINKAINQYINRVYNFYDINQQKTDDLRVLKSTAILSTTLNSDFSNQSLLEKTYEVDLPDDYLHILNCVVEYNVAQNFKCYNSGDRIHFGAKRLTADMYSQIINNYYMRPSYKNPYYYINNVNINTTYPTTDNQESVDYFNKFIITGINNEEIRETDTITVNGVIFTFKDTATISTDIEIGSNIANTMNNLFDTLDGSTDPLIIENSYALTEDNVVTITGNTHSLVSISANGLAIESLLGDMPAGYRKGNKSKVRMEIRYGKDNTLFVLNKIYIDYLKAPQYLRLTQEQVDEVEDNSQLLEFPDYVNQEIVNELIKLLMENASDPRLQTNIPVNQSIAIPQQQQTKK